jgi:pimeloyl-ACP methyl ester carboxylesterase
MGFHKQGLMLEDEAKLQETTDQVVANMLAANVAEKKFYTDERLKKEYSNLITPDAFDKKLIVIAVLGYPEQVGVWSYTLLRQLRVSESSMEPYFREFGKHGFGLVAINPNFFGPNIEGDSFVYQLERVVADTATDKKMGFIGFSMGGNILVDFLGRRPELLDRVAGLVLIDPTLPNRLKVGNIRRLLDNDTLLIASEGEVNSPGEIASALLRVPKISFPGIHGEMPNKALGEIITFYEERTP